MFLCITLNILFSSVFKVYLIMPANNYSYFSFPNQMLSTYLLAIRLEI